MNSEQKMVKALQKAERALLNWISLYPENKDAIDVIALEAITEVLSQQPAAVVDGVVSQSGMVMLSDEKRKEIAAKCFSSDDAWLHADRLERFANLVAEAAVKEDRASRYLKERSQLEAEWSQLREMTAAAKDAEQAFCVPEDWYNLVSRIANQPEVGEKFNPPSVVWHWIQEAKLLLASRR